MKQTIKHESQIHHTFAAAAFRQNGEAFKVGRDFAMDEMPQLMQTVGFGATPSAERQLLAGVAMDAIQQPILTANAGVPVQLLQNFMLGIVEGITSARLIDKIVGLSTVGAWEDEQIVQQVIENTGAAVPYGDDTIIPLSDYNVNFETRTVVRFEQGMSVGIREEAIASRMNVNTAAQKRRASTLNLERARNQVGFYGYNGGNNRTYGLLNDPSLPAYNTVASSGTAWAAKTFLQIQADILTALQGLRTQSQENIDPGSTPITMTVATNSRDYMAKTSDFGISVMKWLNDTYPNVTVISCPEYNQANGGSNIFTLHAETVADSGTDDGRTFAQIVPAKFMLLGIEKGAKSYKEAYSNATAGVMCKRPYAVYRASGI